MAHRTLSSGTLLANRYRIDRLIKSGGFAAVYVAVDLKQRKRCAVKETFDPSADGAEQFRLEADILAGVRHPNLPAVWDYFQHSGGLYLVMEYIEGDDLESRLEMLGSLSEDDTRDWAIQLCDAVLALHTHVPPIIHRDIKPANIKITPEGQAVLVDFGIAKLYRAGNNTQVAARAVTDGFSPLEQYGQGSTDGRSDIYALGATLYNLLSGVIPPDAPSRVSEEMLVPPSRFQPGITPYMESIVMRALQLRPSDRFQSAEEMRRALVTSATPAARVSGNLRTTGNLGRHAEAQSGIWYCASCQSRNLSSSAYCVNCGAPAPTLEVEQPTRIIPPTLAPRSVPRAPHERPWEMMIGPAGGALMALGGRPGQGLVACGERGLVLVHNGETWVTLPTATSYTLYAISAAPAHVWAVGEFGTVAHFTNSRWSTLANEVDDTLHAIALDSPTSGWISGESGSLIDLRDQLLDPLPVRRGQVRSIAIDDVGDGWAVGNSSLLLRLAQGAWKPRTTATGWGDLAGVDFSRPGEAWAVGENGLLLRLDDSGWQVSPSLGLPTLQAIAFNRRGEGWAVGEQGALTWYDGERWLLPTVAPVTTVTLRSVAWLNDDEAWAVGERGVVMRWRR